MVWMQLGENVSALRTPVQGAAAVGACQRSGPIGAAAKGMPLKTEIAVFFPAMPDTSPDAVFTGFGVASVMASVRQAAAIVAAAKRIMPVILLELVWQMG